MNITPEQLHEIAIRCGNDTLIHIEQGMDNEYQIICFAAALFTEFQKLQASQSQANPYKNADEGVYGNEYCDQKLQAEQEPVAWTYMINEAHSLFSTERPPDDAYDEGTLYPLYAAPPDLSADWLRKHNAQVLRVAADKLEKKNGEYANEVGYHEEDTGAYVCQNKYTESALEATGDAIQYLRDRAAELEEETKGKGKR